MNRTQLILTVIAAVILTFSVTFSSLGQRTEGALGLYITVGGLLMAFLSVFLSFGYVFTITMTMRGRD